MCSSHAFTAADHAHMTRALQLAGRGVYSTPPNPAVGCVVLDAESAVAGEGWHVRAGEPHAEVLALRAADHRAKGGTAYVTLEPCNHHGRTPPCVDALVAAGVRSVVAAMIDPNPLTAGAGERRLREAGIDVRVGLLEAEARELNRGFVSRMTRGRPWVTLKLGASLDGRTALADGSSQWITGDAARADVQTLRARASAILTGIGTVLNDDPVLTVRDPQLDLRGRAPTRVVLDARGAMRPTARVVTDGHSTLILTSDAGAARLREQLGAKAGGPVVIDAAAVDGHGRIDLAAVMVVLAARDCNEVLVEAGPRLAGSFLAARLVDELVLYVAPSVLGDTARPLFALPEPLRSLDERYRFAFHDVQRVGDDVRLTLRPTGVGG
jgi:diaminohydroxyphosphoribosylaminopyrimidine deaminase/5-amino-6-(5-phosphoribosylamino)uracil reductase